MLHLTISIIIGVNPPAWEAPVGMDWFIGDCNPVSIAIGYGDWATNTEGPHPGLDFTVDDEYLHSPLASDGCIIGQWPPVSAFHISTQGSLVFGSDNPENTNWGWQIDHIEKPLTAERWADYSPGTYVGSGTNLDLQASPDNTFRHFHLYWMWVWYSSSYGDWVPGARYNGEDFSPKRGYINPIQYLPQEDLIGYDTVRYNRVIEEAASQKRGIWFSPDGTETADQFGLLISAYQFQEAIFGKVDFSVSPYSAFGDLPNRDSCGVYSVGHKLAWVNPYIGTYDPVYYENVFDSNVNQSRAETDYDYRTLFEMKNELPYESDLLPYPTDTDKYRAAFLDGNCPGESNSFFEIPEWWFDSAYILSNSGNLQPGPTGWENVFTLNNSLCYNYWSSNVMCAGGWDTRLRRGDRGGSENDDQAPISQYSVFPDGEYLVDVTATSQGSAFLASPSITQRYLPSENIDDPTSNEDPIVVDNHRPYVDSIIVYSKGFSSSAIPTVFYTAGWDENTESMVASLDQHVYGYPASFSFDRLWIAVRYSEPMNTSKDEVFMTAELNGDITWSSERFVPADVQSYWPDRFGELNTSRLSDGVWYLYYHTGLSPNAYKGPITIAIKQTPDLCDYAGNMIDGNPSTIAHARNSDGSYPSANYESEDNYYTWGNVGWSYDIDQENQFLECIASVGNTELARIDLSTKVYDWSDDWDRLCSFGASIDYSSGVYFFVDIYNDEHTLCFCRSIYVLNLNECLYWKHHEQTSSYVYFGPDLWYTYDENSSTSYPGNYLWRRMRKIWAPIYGPDWSQEVWHVINGQTGDSYMAYMFTYFGDEKCDAWYCSTTKKYYYINSNNPEPVFTGNSVNIPVYFIDDGSYQHYYMGNVNLGGTAGDANARIHSDNETSNLTHEGTMILEINSINPNPANDLLLISVSIPQQAFDYGLEVRDISGRVVIDLSESILHSGHNTVSWDLRDESGTSVPSGCYFVQLITESESIVEKFTIIH